ncbi:MAG: hypothetical protein AAGF46_06355 [Pseudomonadota bacterium]
MTLRRKTAVLVLAVALITGMVLLALQARTQPAGAPVDRSLANLPPPTEAREAVSGAIAAPSPDAERVIEQGPVEPPATTDQSTETAEQPCVNWRAFGDLPEVRAEYERMSPIMPFGQDFQVFLGLDTPSLEALAEQGDSAAMAMLGSMRQMQSRGIPEEFAVTVAASGFRSTVGTGVFQNMQRTVPTDEERTELLIEAQSWFTQSAEHGRVGSLLQLAGVQRRLGETPVSLGWITAEDWDALDEEARDNLRLNDVYLQALTTLAPELATGMGTAMLDRVTATDLSTNIANKIADDLLNATATNNAQVPVLAPSAVPSWAEMESRVCDNSGFGLRRRRR